MEGFAIYKIWLGRAGLFTFNKQKQLIVFMCWQMYLKYDSTEIPQSKILD